MASDSNFKKKVHQGRNVKRFREMLGIKQEALAIELGEEWTQKKVSFLEQKDVLDDKILLQIAQVLKVPPEAIENFDEEQAIHIISNTFNDSSILNGINYNPTFNPIDKWLVALEENKKLYERLLVSEQHKVDLLQKILESKK